MPHLKVNTKAEKESRFVNWAAVARRYRIHKSSIYHTLAGRMRSQRIRQIIANALGMRVESIWREDRAA